MYSLQAAAEIVGVGRCLSFNSLHRFIILGHYHKACWNVPSCSELVPNPGEMIHSEFYATVYSVALNVRSVLSIQLSAYCPSLKGQSVWECVSKAYSALSLPTSFAILSHV